MEQEILTLEMKVNEAKQEEIEIEELLDFSENLLLNAAATWSGSGLEQKQRLQQILFPQGASYCGGLIEPPQLTLFSICCRKKYRKEVRW